MPDDIMQIIKDDLQLDYTGMSDEAWLWLALSLLQKLEHKGYLPPDTTTPVSRITSSLEDITGHSDIWVLDRCRQMVYAGNLRYLNQRFYR